MDAADATTSIAPAGAHVDAADATTLVADVDAPMGAFNKLDAAILRTQAKAALTELGWKPAIAAAAVAAAAAAQSAEVTLERLVFESLRQCPAPKV